MVPVTVVRTYLDLPPHVRYDRTAPPSGAAWRELPKTSWRQVRDLYALVGADYHWVDRNAWSDEAWATHVQSPGVRAFVLEVAGRDAGYVELARTGEEVEIAYFGLASFAHGRGLGRWLLEQAIAEAQAWHATRVWLHTCTLDAAAALPNYLARGFVVTRRETYTVQVPA